MELKHNPGLIASLAFETSKMYTTAADSLATLDQKIFGHWRQYFILKTKFYQAYVSSAVQPLKESSFQIGAFLNAALDRRFHPLDEKGTQPMSTLSSV